MTARPTLSPSIEQLHSRYKSGELKPSEWIDSVLKSAEQSKLNAYLRVTSDRARAQGAAADAALSADGASAFEKYPLLGIPLAIKDNLVIDGVETTCASRILEGYIPPYTATCVARLEAAGAVTIGKTNLDEFAMGSSNENSSYGSVIHPTHPDRVPGGSSGGSAAAVGGGLCLGALGSDTGGSIRLPASFCGVVGLKPTYGRVSRYGLVAFASSLDQVGPLTTTVEDSARILEVMAGQDRRDSTTAPVEREPWAEIVRQGRSFKGLKIGVPREYFVSGVAPDVERATKAALKWAEGEGAHLVDISLPHTQYSIATYYVVAVSEASSNLARYDGVHFGARPKDALVAGSMADFYETVRSLFGPEVKRRIILGTFALSSGYYDAYYRRACQVRRLISQDFQKAFEKVDVIAGPTAPFTAFKSGERSKDPLQMYLVDVYTIAANLAGIPSISIPCGVDSARLPIGLQLAAPHFSEALLLSVAKGFESR